jgi:hypothetical protein
MTTLRLLLVSILLALGSAPSSSWATVITFQDGGPEGTPISGHYAGLGVQMPIWEFWDSTLPGDAFPFFDSRGALRRSDPAEIRFAQPIHGLTVDGFLQATGPLQQWTLTAYDTADSVLGSVSGTIIGVGSPIPGTFHTFLPSSLSLNFEGNQILRVEITQGGPFDPDGARYAIDTLLFTPDLDLTPIPEPTTLLLWGGAAGVGVVRWLTRRRSG